TIQALKGFRVRRSRAGPERRPSVAVCPAPALLRPPFHLRILGRIPEPKASIGGNMRSVSTIIAAGALAVVFSAPAQAQGTQANIETKAQVCNACHGQNGVPL